MPARLASKQGNVRLKGVGFLGFRENGSVLSGMWARGDMTS